MSTLEKIVFVAAVDELFRSTGLDSPLSEEEDNKVSHLLDNYYAGGKEEETARELKQLARKRYEELLGEKS